MPLSPCSERAAPAASPSPGVPAPCCDAHAAPGDIALERNRYFTGKYMTERDFQDEQWYFLSRAWLHQRTLHGWGVVCGLDVEPHSNPECAKVGWVVVLPGMAIDSYGRTIVLRDKTPVLLPNLGPSEGNADFSQTTPPPTNDKDFLLGIRYREQCIEPVPLLYDDHHCGQKLAYNRIAETAAFCWGGEDTTGKCWYAKKPTDPCAPCDPTRECLDLACPCGVMMPLALIKKSQQKPPTWVIVKDRLCFDGVRYLPGPLAPRTFTHICHTNWTHGARVKLAVLENPDEATSTVAESCDPAPQPQPSHGHHHHHHGQHQRFYLAIKFDRALKLVEGSPDKAMGLDEHTLVVEFSDGHGPRKVLPPDSIKVEELHVLGCQRGQSRALIAFDKSNCQVEELIRAVNCGHALIHVTLKCDFLEDYRGRAVDGNFLRGVLPTGDGIEGGTFESWFTLTN